MRLAGLLLFPGSLLVIAAVACSAKVPQGDPNAADPNADPSAAQVPNRTSGATAKNASTCLGKAGFDFAKPACNTCMNSADCCAATIGCFAGNAECSALQDCMAACGGGGTGTGPGTGGGEGGTTAPNPGAAAAAKAGFVNNVHPALIGTCGSCHSAGGAGPQFFAATADLSYPLFINSGFNKPNSLLLNKGAHEGPALTAAQKTTINSWVALESAVTPGGGGGGGGGAGDGGGGGTGAGGTKLACQSACRTKHPTAVMKWDTYDTCVAKTCASSCL